MMKVKNPIKFLHNCYSFFLCCHLPSEYTLQNRAKLFGFDVLVHIHISHLYVLCAVCVCSLPYKFRLMHIIELPGVFVSQ